jgi:putative endonuclease
LDGVSEHARQHLGAAGEQLAAEHLERLGYEIVERNFRTRWGELDIVAYNGEVLAFCEVKTRRFGPGGGMTLEAVRPAKQRQVRRMAFSWLRERTERPYAPELRFDAIGVTFDLEGRLVGIEHLEGAF